MEIHKKIGVFLLVIQLLSANLYAQIKPEFSRILTEQNWVYQYYSLGDKGIALIGYEGNDLRILILDTLVNIRHELRIDSKKSSGINNIKFNPTSEEILLFEVHKGNKYSMQRVNVISGQITSQSIQEFPKCTFNTDFVVIQDKIWIIGSSKLSDSIYIYDFQTLAFIRKITVNKVRCNINRIRYIGEEEVSIDFYYSTAEGNFYDISLFDTDGIEIEGSFLNTFEDPFRYKIYQATLIRQNYDEYLIIGTFTDDGLKECGMFFGLYIDGIIDEYTYYYFKDRDQFFEYLNPSYDTTEHSDWWKRDKLDAYYGGHNNLHQTFEIDGKIYFYCEFYSIITNPSSGFSGYYYYNAYLVVFDTDGEILTDGAFRINERHTPYTVIDYTKVVSDSNMFRIYNCGKTECMIIDVEDDEIKKKTFETSIEYKTNLTTRIQDNEINYWYGPYFFVIRKQEHTNPKNHLDMIDEIVITKARIPIY